MVSDWRVKSDRRNIYFDEISLYLKKILKKGEKNALDNNSNFAGTMAAWFFFSNRGRYYTRTFGNCSDCFHYQLSIRQKIVSKQGATIIVFDLNIMERRRICKHYRQPR